MFECYLGFSDGLVRLERTPISYRLNGAYFGGVIWTREAPRLDEFLDGPGHFRFLGLLRAWRGFDVRAEDLSPSWLGEILYSTGPWTLCLLRVQDAVFKGDLYPSEQTQDALSQVPLEVLETYFADRLANWRRRLTNLLHLPNVVCVLITSYMF